MINLARFLADLLPSGAPGAPGTGPALKIVQVAPKISPGDKLYVPFVGCTLGRVFICF